MNGRETWTTRKFAVLERVSLWDAVTSRVALKHTRGAEHVGLCPFHGERTPSFTLNITKGFYHCFGCGAHGSNAIDFVMALDHLSFVQAIELLESESGLRAAAAVVRPPAPKLRPTTRKEAWRRRAVAELWNTAGEVLPNSIVDRYLRGRHLLPPRSYLGTSNEWGPAGWPIDLRFHPEVWHAIERRALPTMVAAFRNDAGNVQALHRTYLKATAIDATKAGTSRDKAHLGNRRGCSIRLSASDSHMVGGEGIETSLAAMQLWHRRGLAFGSADGMARVELPFQCGDFIYAADWNRESRVGEKAAFAGAKLNRLCRTIDVRIPNLADRAKADFNDWLTIGADKANAGDATDMESGQDAE